MYRHENVLFIIAAYSLHEQVKISSEHLQSVLDARDKAVCGTTYRQLNDVIAKVKGCTYFTETEKVTATDAVEGSWWFLVFLYDVAG